MTLLFCALVRCLERVTIWVFVLCLGVSAAHAADDHERPAYTGRVIGLDLLSSHHLSMYQFWSGGGQTEYAAKEWQAMIKYMKANPQIVAIGMRQLSGEHAEYHPHMTKECELLTGFKPGDVFDAEAHAQAIIADSLSCPICNPPKKDRGDDQVQPDPGGQRPSGADGEKGRGSNGRKGQPGGPGNQRGRGRGANDNEAPDGNGPNDPTQKGGRGGKSQIPTRISDGQRVGPLGAEGARPGDRPKEIASPLVRFKNGIMTEAPAAVGAAKAIGDRLGVPVELNYWATSGSIVGDLARAGSASKQESADLSNVSAKSVYEDMKQTVEAGGHYYVVAHSAGAIDVKNALLRYDFEMRNRDPITIAERHDRLSRIHVITAGAGTTAEGWPKIGSVFHICHERDGVAKTFGPGAFNFTPGSIGVEHDFMRTYLPAIEPWMFARSGSMVINEHGRSIQFR